MPADTSTTRWRDQRIVPTDYEDVAALVKLARQARRQVVDFSWTFSRDDLEHSRRAVYEWGSRVQGRYKCFDARVLKAINLALGETSTVFVLSEPRGSTGLDCVVECVPDAEGFRLRGHAPFDLVFGYGEACVQESGRGRAFLGPAVRETLATSVGTLGWDLRRLQDPSLRQAWNAIYGFSPNYSTGVVPSHPGPELRVDIEFQGPYSAVDDGECRCLFADPIAGLKGIYLWTIAVNGIERVWYMGQTRRGFGQRMGEHLTKMLSGEYPPHDPVALSRGDSATLCGGVEALSGPLAIPAFVRNWEALMPQIVATIRLLKFHVAPFDGDAHLLDRAEGAIGRYYKAHPVYDLSSFVMPGIRVPAGTPGDQPMRLALSSLATIAGLPLEILEPSAPMPSDLREFVDSAPWTFAKTYAATWPHEYVVRTPENAEWILGLAGHIAEHGVAGRFYSEVRRYHREGGKVYWFMAETPEDAGLINRCDAGQTYEARLAAGTLPDDAKGMDDMESAE